MSGLFYFEQHFFGTNEETTLCRTKAVGKNHKKSVSIFLASLGDGTYRPGVGTTKNPF